VWLGLESDPEDIIDTADAELWRESGDETDGENSDQPDRYGEEEYRARVRTVDAVDMYTYASKR